MNLLPLFNHFCPGCVSALAHVQVLSVSPDKKVIVATNAIGFLCAEVTHPTKHPDWSVGAAAFGFLKHSSCRSSLNSLFTTLVFPDTLGHEKKTSRLLCQMVCP